MEFLNNYNHQITLEDCKKKQFYIDLESCVNVHRTACISEDCFLFFTISLPSFSIGETFAGEKTGSFHAQDCMTFNLYEDDDYEIKEFFGETYCFPINSKEQPINVGNYETYMQIIAWRDGL